MTNFRPIFENDWCGIETFLKDVLSPVFGDYEQGYDVLTNEPEVREKAKNANITEIRHAATFDFFGSELKVFDISVGDNKKLENNKVGIQTIVRQYINQFEGALIIFHHQKVENQEWRFSYVEKRVNAKDSTSAKRYTYILGKGHPARTIAERFKDLESKKDKDETILLPALTNAFSVAPLSDDFFNEYREHYADLVEYISGKRFVKKGGKFVEEKTKNANGAFKSAFDGDDKFVRDYVKKMMGRLVFLHFLQKKGWLGVPVNAEWGSGDKNFIYNLFKNADENIKSDFLEQALEPLFFNTLNNNRGEEAIAPKVICDIYGSKIRIPYLNGGLFEEDELDTKQVKFKKEHFEELLEFFNQYNFTIDETDPDDQEIGVDPEMLGKIFENLLEDNKDKGAFYTPKEIVQYMCRESLIAYLEEKTGIDTRDFVINHTHTFNESQKANILKALLDVKICDPAVGSGAFPMGMMNELLACTQLLTGETKTRSWLKKHIVKNNIYGVDIEKGAVDIARLRFWLAIIVDEDKPQPLPNLDYKIMQGNSLLECFENIDLSSIAKEEVISGKGKNLLEEYEDPDDAWKEIKNAQLLGFKYDLSEYYDISDHIKKAKLQKDIMDFVKNRIIDKLDFETKNIRKRSIELDAKESAIHSSLKSFSLDSNDPAAIRLRKDLDKIIAEKKKIEEVLLNNQEKQNRVLDLAFNNTEFFLWHTWFGDVFNRPNDCNGFDIVIGNPPYGAKTSDKDKALYKKYYEATKTYSGISKGSTDTFAVFVNLGYDLLAKNGNLAYIIPMAVTSSDAMTTLHNLLENNCETIRVSSYSNRPKQIFDAACIRTSVFFYKKTLTKNEHIYTTKLQRRRYTDSIGEIIDGLEYIDSKELKLPGRYAKISVQREKDILTKLFATGKNIASYADEKGNPFYYRTSGGRYFNVISDVPTGSTQDKPYYVQKNLNSVIAATLSTTLFWFYCQVYTDGLHIKSTELDTFPLPDFSKINEKTILAIKNKYAEYLSDIECNVIQHSTFKEYKLRKSKHLIDQLDELICPLYVLSKEETEFIKNYEIEFRVEDE